MEEKPIYLSKTFWTNVIVAAAYPFMPEEWKNPEYVVYLLAAVNMVLRLMTKEKVSLWQSNTTMGWLDAIPTVLKLILFFVDKYKQTDQASRREALAELDKAIDLANEKNDLTKLSEWFGRRL